MSCQGQPGARPIVSFVAVAGVADAAVDESRRIDLKLLYRSRQERIGTRRRIVSRRQCRRSIRDELTVNEWTTNVMVELLLVVEQSSVALAPGWRLAS